MRRIPVPVDPFTGSVAIAGAQGLIGSALSAHLSQAGWLVHELDIRGGQDLLDESVVAQFFARNRLDALINAAGLNHSANEQSGQGTSYLSYSMNSVVEMLRANVQLAYLLSRSFIQGNSSGIILNFSSIHAESSPPPGQYAGGDKHPMYGPSKAAVESLTRYLAVHAGPKYRINCIRLGGVQDAQSQDFIRAYSARTALQRMARLPDVAGLVDFLLSSDSSYITGQVLSLDGGWGLSP